MPRTRRGVSPAIGYVLIVAFLLSMGALLFGAGSWAFDELRDPEVADPEFQAEIENTDTYGIQYAGDTELTCDSVRVYDNDDFDTQLTRDQDDYGNKIMENETVVGNMSDTFELGSTLGIVCIEDGDEELLDTIVLPSFLQVLWEEGGPEMDDDPMVGGGQIGTGGS